MGEEAVEAVGSANPQLLLEQSESVLSGLDANTRLALQVLLLPSLRPYLALPGSALPLIVDTVCLDREMRTE